MPINEITGLFAMSLLGEVPWRAAVFGSADVESTEALDIYISTDIVLGWQWCRGRTVRTPR